MKRLAFALLLVSTQALADDAKPAPPPPAVPAPKFATITITEQDFARYQDQIGNMPFKQAQPMLNLLNFIESDAQAKERASHK